MPYDAFFSYSHAADAQLAAKLQSALHRFAKPWYRLRALRVFRDKTNLAAAPALWPSIERAINESKFLVLLASPQAAQSHWVEREVSWWLEHRTCDRLLIAVTDGEIAWTEAARDFDWKTTTVLPPSLRGKFSDEPLYVDLRWTKNVEQLSLASQQFRGAVLDLAATLHGRPKDELDGEDVTQHRKTRSVATAAVGLIVCAAVVATWLAIVATRQRDRAQKLYVQALGRQLAAQSQERFGTRPDLLPTSVLLATESMRRFPSIEADRMLRTGLALLPTQLWKSSVTSATPVGLAFTPDGTRIVSADAVLNAENGELIGERFRHEGRSTAFAISRNGKRVARGGGAGIIGVWDTVSGAPVSTFRMQPLQPVGTLALSPDGAWLAVAGNASTEVEIHSTGDGSLATTIADPQPQPWGGVTVVAFSDDGRYLGIARRDSVVLAAAPTWQTTIWTATDAEVTGLAFSPNSTRIATLSESSASESSVDVWTRNGEHQAEFTIRARAFGGGGVGFSPDGKLLGAWSLDAVVWDLDSKSELVSLPSGGGLVFSSDSSCIATHSGSTASVTELPRGREFAGARELARMAHEGRVDAVAFSPDGRRLATVISPGSVRLWESSADYSIACLAGDPHGWTADGKYFIAATADGVASIWHEGSGETTRIPPDGDPRALDVSADGARLVTVHGDRASVWAVSGTPDVVHLDHTPPIDWEAVRKREEERGNRSAEQVHWQIEAGQRDGSVAVAALSTDGRYLLTTRADEIARLWDCSTGRELAQMPYKSTLAADFSGNGARFAIASPGSGVRVWDTATTQLVATLAATHDDVSVTLDREGRRIVLDDEAGASVWDVDRPMRPIAEIAATDSAHWSSDRRLFASEHSGVITVVEVSSGRMTKLDGLDRVWRIEFSLDGRYLAIAQEIVALAESDDAIGQPRATGGPDSAAVLVVETSTGRELATLALDGAPWGLCFSFDGRFVAVGDRVWDVATAKEMCRVGETIHAFSHDGCYIATCPDSADSLTRISPWRAKDLIEVATKRLPRAYLCRDEWLQFAGHVPEDAPRGGVEATQR